MPPRGGVSRHSAARVRIDLPFAIRCRSCGSQAAKHTRFIAAKLQGGRKLVFHCRRCGASLTLLRDLSGAHCGPNTERVPLPRESVDPAGSLSPANEHTSETNRAHSRQPTYSAPDSEGQAASGLGQCEGDGLRHDASELNVQEVASAEDDLEQAIRTQRETKVLESARMPVEQRGPSRSFTICTDLTISAEWADYLAPRDMPTPEVQKECDSPRDHSKR